MKPSSSTVIISILSAIVLGLLGFIAGSYIKGVSDKNNSSSSSVSVAVVSSSSVSSMAKSEAMMASSTAASLAVVAPDPLPTPVKDCTSFLSKAFANLAFCAPKIWIVQDKPPIILPDDYANRLNKSVVLTTAGGDVLSFDFKNTVGLGPNLQWIGSGDFVQVNDIWSRMKGPGAASSYIYVRNTMITKKGTPAFTATLAQCVTPPGGESILNCEGATTADAYVTNPTKAWIYVLFDAGVAGAAYPAQAAQFAAYKSAIASAGLTTMLNISFFGANPLAADEIMKTMTVDFQ
jgi:hypothetical protein